MQTDFSSKDLVKIFSENKYPNKIRVYDFEKDEMVYSENFEHLFEFFYHCEFNYEKGYSNNNLVIMLYTGFKEMYEYDVFEWNDGKKGIIVFDKITGKWVVVYKENKNAKMQKIGLGLQLHDGKKKGTIFDVSCIKKNKGVKVL
ncbi:MAG: hypothetical protein ACOC56_03600 [Atribacterota bacterium]